MVRRLLLCKRKHTPTHDLDYISEMSSHEEGHFYDANEGDKTHANKGNIDASQGKRSKIHG